MNVMLIAAKSLIVWLRGDTSIHVTILMFCVGQRAARTRKSATDELAGSDGEAVETEKPPTPPPSLPEAFPVTPKAAMASCILVFIFHS